MNKILGKSESDADVLNSQPKVLLIGYGWVGQYCGKYFTNADIYTSKGWQRHKLGHYNLAIISTPTPMNPETGECDTSIVESVVKKFQDRVDYFLCKSTIEIGTTDRLCRTYGVKMAMSPEYVGETLGHPLLEPRRDTFQIIGGTDEVTEKIASFWRTVLHANAPILVCTAKEAEIIKYCENYWIMQRVDYWNDVYEISKTLGGSFTRIREGLVLDPRFSRTHSNVYPENRGWSGKCLPKDMTGLAYTMRKMGRPLTTLECQIKKNAELRKGYKSKIKLIPDKW